MRTIFAIMFSTFVVGALPGRAVSQTAEELIGEMCVIPDAPPFQCPVKYAASFGQDESAVFSSGKPLSKVSGAPGAGEYNVAGGLYVFNAADHGKGVLVSYTFTPPRRP